MMSLVVPGGWYIDATEDASAVLMPGSHIDTSHGRVELPVGQNVLQLRLAEDGIRLAGTGHDGTVQDLACEWSGSSWTTHGTAHGVNACIYDEADELVIARADSGTGSQGYRYLADDGRLVTGDETYADPTRRIWEYTTHGDVTIGQSGKGPDGEDAVLALYGTHRYILQQGQCRFIRFRRYGDDLVLAWVQEDRREARVLRLTVADLATFPQQQTAPPIPPKPIPPDPEPQPPEPPEPPPLHEGNALMVLSAYDPSKKLVAVTTVKPTGQKDIFTLILPGVFTDTAGDYGPKGQIYTNCVFSMQPDGTDGWRPPGADGAYERCRVSGNLSTFQPAGEYYTRAFVIVEGL